MGSEPTKNLEEIPGTLVLGRTSNKKNNKKVGGFSLTKESDT